MRTFLVHLIRHATAVCRYVSSQKHTTQVHLSQYYMYCSRYVFCRKPTTCPDIPNSPSLKLNNNDGSTRESTNSLNNTKNKPSEANSFSFFLPKPLFCIPNYLKFLHQWFLIYVSSCFFTAKQNM